MLPLLKLARAGWGLAPGSAYARLSLIHVDDLARALLALATEGPSKAILELDDGQGAHGGYSHQQFATLAAEAQGRSRVRMVPVPPALLSGASCIATLIARLTGQQPRLSRDRARYLAHPDWVARGGNAQLAGLWAPQIDAATGLATTMAQARQTR
jgi:nucleoside-diphosphate-sugar epimerase